MRWQFVVEMEDKDLRVYLDVREDMGQWLLFSAFHDVGLEEDDR